MMKRVAAFCVLASLLAGCLTPSEITPTQYFTLDPQPEVETFAPTDLTLGNACQ